MLRSIHYDSAASLTMATTLRRVLVLDDDPHILEVLTMRLDAMGCDVTATADPSEALRKLGQHGFELALVDLRMKPIDGIAFMKAAHEIHPRLPVLIMTAHGTIESAIDAIRAGALDYLTKPFVAEELRGKIGRALAERRWARNRGLLRTVGEALASASTMQRVLESVALATVDATETERAVVFLWEDGAAVPRASAGRAGAALEHLVPAAEAAIRQRAATRLIGGGERTILAAPLLVNGVGRGALVTENARHVVATEDDLELLMVFASQVAAALRNAQELAGCRSGALTALGRVATEVAHELNNPLGGLKLYAELLEERLARAEDAKGVELVQRTKRAVDRLAALVGDITAFGRPPELRRDAVNVNALLDDCIGLVSDRIVKKDIRVIRDIDATLGEVSLDPRELHKALLNLILNALDAMEAQGTLTLRTRRRDDQAIELWIEDTGGGMDEATLSRLFDLFFTTKPAGTGLGMAIVRSSVERHGGRLEVESTLGRGTRIRIELPIIGG